MNTQRTKKKFLYAFGLAIFCCLAGVADTEAQNAELTIVKSEDGRPVAFEYDETEDVFLRRVTQRFTWRNICENVKEVSVSNNRFSDHFFEKYLSQMTGLRSLVIGQGIGPGETEIEVGSYRHLESLISLEKLEIVCYEDAGDKARADYTFLTRLNSLKILYVFDHLTDADLDSIVSCSDLQELIVWGITSASQEQLVSLSQLEHLIKLEIGEVKGATQQALNSFFRGLSKAKKIQSFSLFNERLFQAEVSPIGKLKRLSRLKIGTVNANQIGWLSDLREIKDLELLLRYDGELVNLSFVKNMRSLKQFRVRCSDPKLEISLDELKNNASIESLDIGTVHVLRTTDLPAINSMTRLRYLCVAESSLSKKELSELRERLEVKIWGTKSISNKAKMPNSKAKNGTVKSEVKPSE